MGVGLGPKNFQTWIWDGFSPCLVILVSWRSILVSVLIFWPVAPFILIQTTPCHMHCRPKILCKFAFSLVILQLIKVACPCDFTGFQLMLNIAFCHFTAINMLMCHLSLWCSWAGGRLIEYRELCTHSEAEMLSSAVHNVGTDRHPPSNPPSPPCRLWDVSHLPRCAATLSSSSPSSYSSSYSYSCSFSPDHAQLIFLQKGPSLTSNSSFLFTVNLFRWKSGFRTGG